VNAYSEPAVLIFVEVIKYKYLFHRTKTPVTKAVLYETGGKLKQSKQYYNRSVDCKLLHGPESSGRLVSYQRK